MVGFPDIGPFQDIIEVGWAPPSGGFEPSDEGWQILILACEDDPDIITAEWVGGVFSWTVTLRIFPEFRDEDNFFICRQRRVSGTRRIVLPAAKNVAISISIDDGTGDNSDQFTVTTSNSFFFQRTADGQIGSTTASVVEGPGPVEIFVAATSASVNPGARPDTTEMTVTFTWSDL